MSRGIVLSLTRSAFTIALERSPLLYPVILQIPCEAEAFRGRQRLEAQRVAAREALVRSCKISGRPCGPFEKDAHNAPLPFAGCYWSISHKPQFVAAVVSADPVGIDLEEIVPRHKGLFGYLAEDAEWALAGNQEWETFFRYWTAKEAVLKATGAGLRDLKKVRIQRVVGLDHLIVQYEGHQWRVQHYRFQNHLASLTQGDDVRWTLIER
jgi:4'-phosphopantetheinyl transferase